MCGILNVIDKHGKPLDISSCRRALHSLTLRGPDSCTYKIVGNNVFLGQTILSITGDLKSGYDHLSSVSGNYQLCLNGEIYNYRELETRYLKGKVTSGIHSGIDSQVLVNMHEMLPMLDIPELLDGMVAYSLLDKKKNIIGICRDIQGEKSLYIYEDDNMIIISSEIRPIQYLMPNLKIDPQILRDYFYIRHFMFMERTLHHNVRQLLPGHMEILNLDTMEWKRHRYFNMNNWIDAAKIEEYSRRSKDSLVDELDSLMNDCVKQMIPERNYASVVSGGVDSSLISYYVVKNGDPNLMIAVNHVGKDKISCDLSGFEKALKRKIKVLDINYLTYSSEIPRCQKICGGPLFSHSFIGQSIQSAFVRSRDCRVLFGGDGADELFGGYPCYLENRKVNMEFSPSLYSGYFKPEIEFEENNTTDLKKELSAAWRNSYNAYNVLENHDERIAQAMMHCDFTWQLPSVGMRGTDFMSLMWNIETRTVFLRHPIIRFALNLPVNLKSNMEDPNPLMKAKPLLKKLFLRYFPSDLLVEKQGFAGFPNEAAAFLGEVEDFMALDILKIRRESIKKELSRSTKWKLVNIEYFLREVL